MGLFGLTFRSQGAMPDTIELVQKYLRTISVDPDSNAVDASEGIGWWIRRGSAVIYLFILEEKKGPIIKITSPILHFPDSNREAFFLRLLEINSDLNECCLCAFQEIVLLSAQRPTAGLDFDELSYIISYMARTADDLDDKLAREFRAMPYTEDPHCQR